MDMTERLERHRRYAWSITVRVGVAHMDLWGETVGGGETASEAREAVRVFSAGRMKANPALVQIVRFEIAPV